MSRRLLGVAMVIVGGCVALGSLLLALLVFATSASHGGGSLETGLLLAGVVGLLGVAGVVGGLVVAVTSRRSS